MGPSLSPNVWIIGLVRIELYPEDLVVLSDRLLLLRRYEQFLSCICEILSYAIDIVYPLTKVIVANNLRIEFAEVVCLLLRELIAHNYSLKLLAHLFVRIFVRSRIRECGRQPNDEELDAPSQRN